MRTSIPDCLEIPKTLRVQHVSEDDLLLMVTFCHITFFKFTREQIFCLQIENFAFAQIINALVFYNAYVLGS